MKTLTTLAIGLVLLGGGCVQDSSDNSSDDVYQAPAVAEELPEVTTSLMATTTTLPWQSCEEVGWEIVAQQNLNRLLEGDTDYMHNLEDAYPLDVNMLEDSERACMLQISATENISTMPSWRDEPLEFSSSGVACYNDYTWFWGGASEERIVLQIEDCLVLLRSSPREDDDDIELPALSS